MDDQVLRAMTRWPDVPAVWGWLRLDRRGRWLLVDRGHPDFDEARDGGGSPITSPPIIDFIGRNYAGDEHGRWYWQNGPQRVYVDLDSAPLILRVLDADGPTIAARHFVTHTGFGVQRIDAGWIGPAGELLLRTDLGPAVVHDLDAPTLPLEELGDTVALLLDSGLLPLHATTDPAATLGYDPLPRR
ncbi:MAG: DUF2946 family protein [Burkholderiales bacterium]|nr:DUF2946 family protein [Burkholderiales bacterium]